MSNFVQFHENFIFFSVSAQLKFESKMVTHIYMINYRKLSPNIYFKKSLSTTPISAKLYESLNWR